ncbi:MAG: M50 family metallopeptidase [Saprospiraceae bacterium]
MQNSLLLRLLAVTGLYIGLKYFGGEIGRQILYPITLLVTFLHELGHGLGTIITGGKVLHINIESSGAGVTLSQGGWKGVILMGGYIGSAVLGNILFYIGARKEKWAATTVTILCAMMVFTGIYWYNSMFATGFLITFAIGLSLISRFTKLDREILMFLGLASILYIIQDFDVGPSSDLKAYAEHMIIFPEAVWRYLWLGIAVVLCLFNLRLIFRNSPKIENQQY